MKARNILKGTVIAASLAGAALANAANNPLEASYYVEKFAASAPAITPHGNNGLSRLQQSAVADLWA